MESPTSPTPPPPSGSDALDPLESRALGLLRDRDGAAWDELLATVDRDEQAKLLYSEASPIDPSEGRRSSAELRSLIGAVRGAEHEALPPARTRAGYVLEGALDGEARAVPAFAAGIGRAHLRDAFPDLWALDAALWNQLDTADPRELARAWLESPGRRLIQDLGVLRVLPHGGTRGATDLSSARVDAAAGLRLTVASREHRELHRAIPGVALDEWEPEPVDAGEQVLHALRLLEDGNPVGLRGAALAWLLNRAADEPFYTVDAIRRDLRDELPARLTWALATWLRAGRADAIPRRLETLALQHAARIVAATEPDDAATRGWAVARWLQACLRRSPFYGADEEVLAAHLRARLPAELEPLPADADALHPARFELDGAGLDVAEIAFMAGVLAHYEREPDRTLLPTPEPLVHWLQWLAARPVRAAEERADAALSAGRNALGWPQGYSLSPSLAARTLMTELRIGWIAQSRIDEKIGFDAQRDSIECFAHDPSRHAWCAFAIEREGQHLRSDVRERAVEVFEALCTENRARPHVIATFGTGLLEALTPEQADQILDLARRADAEWRPRLIDALAGAAERAGRDAVWARAVEHLIAIMEDSTLPEKVRLDAALFATRRASASTNVARDLSLHQIAKLTAAPPFTDHLGLRREMRRLGLANPSAAGTKR